MAIGVHHHQHLHHHLHYLHHHLEKKIWCYECSTETNPKCGDPFNISLVRGEERDVTLNQCEGCCIKIVKKKDTPQQIIQRTCTGKIQINLFMVDHVCMEESDGKGHMCFCESDACNLGSTINSIDSILLGVITLITVVTVASTISQLT
ncbi:protein quiver-like isoform X2 [Panonychus citri]|uniref:protein quiver-like isoform X2 n=1 Tax=Panonychus citri TaxID=50023 RepID=UPI00230814C4|nr:protein quiver-like isoform X2 [Panonychus citri]